MTTLLRVAGVMGAFLLALAGGHAGAQGYPLKPVRIIVPLGAGGGTDIVARVIAEKLGMRLGQLVVVENRPGAEGVIGVDAAAKSAPDGYTLLMGSSTTVAAIVNLYKKLPFDPVKDLVPVAKALGNSVNILLVNPAFPVQDMKELIALAKSKPGQLNYGAGTSSAKICIEKLKTLAGINMTLVPYKSSGQALTDLMGGQVQLVCEPTVTALQNVKAGKLRALGFTSATRVSWDPDIPTVAESAGLPGYEHSSWIAFFAPAGTPRDIVNRLSAEFAYILTQPDMVSRIKAVGFDADIGGPEELGALHKEEIARSAKVLKDAGIQPQ